MQGGIYTGLYCCAKPKAVTTDIKSKKLLYIGFDQQDNYISYIATCNMFFEKTLVFFFNYNLQNMELIQNIFMYILNTKNNILFHVETNYN